MHARLSVNLISLAGTLAEDLATCASLGAKSIGVPNAKLEGAGWKAGIQAVRASGFRVASVLHRARFTLNDRSAWEPQRAALIRTLDAARLLDAESLYTTSGARGGMPWEEAEQAFIEAVVPVAAYAREIRVPLLIEPVPVFYQDYAFAHTLADTLQLARGAGIGVCIDVSSCWTESRLHETIARCAPLCALVQVADYSINDRSLPNRTVPGDGIIPLERILRWIHESGYRGSYDLELIGPRIESEGPGNAIRRSGEHLAGLFAKIGI